MEINPYSVDRSLISASEDKPETKVTANYEESVSIRQKYILHENSVRNMSAVFLIGAVVMLYGAGVSLVNFLQTYISSSNPLSGNYPLSPTAIWYSFLGLAQIFTGFGLSRLDPRYRWPAVGICAFWLFSIVGTLPSLYFLYVLLSSKTKYVMSEDYKAVIRVTPNESPKTSKTTWLIAAAFSLILIVLILLAFKLA